LLLLYIVCPFQTLDIIFYLFAMSKSRSNRRPPAVPPVPTVSTTSVVEEGAANVDVVFVASKDLPSEPTGSRKDPRSGVCFTIAIIIFISV
jgi:hypothetical protein